MVGWQIGHLAGVVMETSRMSITNCPRGTLVWKYKSITCMVYCELLKDNLIPAIIVKWPPGGRVVRHVRIQQGGAKVHIENNNPEFWEMLVEHRLNAQMITQPVNSPDTNLLDLVFLVVQSGEGQMIELVKKTFAEYPRHKIN